MRAVKITVAASSTMMNTENPSTPIESAMVEWGPRRHTRIHTGIAVAITPRPAAVVHAAANHCGSRPPASDTMVNNSTAAPAITMWGTKGSHAMSGISA